MLSCLTAAALWAVALSLFREPIRLLGPRAVNCFKCTVGGLAFALASLAIGGARLAGSGSDLTLLAISGIAGMAVGDVLLFISVRELGVQRALILFNTSPLITGLAGVPLYGERLSSSQWLGILAILAGVSLVETDPHRRAAKARAAEGQRWLGLLAGLGAAAGQSAGILMARGPLQQVELLPASAVRLSAAAAALLLVMSLNRKGRACLAGLRPAAWSRLVLPTVLGTVIAIFFMMRGIRDTPAGIAAALLATTPIFALPISRYFLGEPIGPRSVLGTLVSVAGVVVLSA